MRNLLKVLVVLSVSAPAFVLAQTQCFGGENFKTCTDYSTGNSYQINKWGNTTQVYGRNPRTGSDWSETSQTFGDVRKSADVRRHLETFADVSSFADGWIGPQTSADVRRR